MDHPFWLSRWRENRIGFHQSEVNGSLQRFWPRLPAHSRVLVPLCGKSLDLLWLSTQGYDVTGVELSPLAVEAFFTEQGMAHTQRPERHGQMCEAVDTPLRILCGDFLAFEADPFDALYDRAALISLPPARRKPYTRHCQDLLGDHASTLLLTIEYDQQRMDGPPFSVSPQEATSLWQGKLNKVLTEELITREPRFRARGLHSLIETTWRSPPDYRLSATSP